MARWVSTAEGKHLHGRRKTDTEPEILLRRALHAKGARFRLHRQLAPGCTPDILLPGRKIAVFVDGDYWHSCPVHGRKTPFTGPNAALWADKMARNRERDRRSTALAEQAGWTVVRIWECVVRDNPEFAAQAALKPRSPAPAGRRDPQVLAETVQLPAFHHGGPCNCGNIRRNGSRDGGAVSQIRVAVLASTSILALVMATRVSGDVAGIATGSAVLAAVASAWPLSLHGKKIDHYTYMITKNFWATIVVATGLVTYAAVSVQKKILSWFNELKMTNFLVPD